MGLQLEEYRPQVEEAVRVTRKNTRRQGERAKRKFGPYLKSLVPSIGWIPKYNLSWLAGDLMAGLTVGTMIVPQALAYGKLTGLNAEYALYTSLVGGIAYSFFGTCRETSIGPTAVISLMVGHAIEDIKERTDFTGGEIAPVMCCICGILSIILGVLRLGFIMEFISNPVILGFTTGSAFTIILTQIAGLLGIPHVNTHAPTIELIKDLVENVRDINWVNLVLGLSSLIKIFQYLQIGSFAIAVILFTLIAFLVKLTHPDLEMNLVGKLKPGIIVALPSSNHNLWATVFPYCIPITAIMLLENLAVGKTFSKAGGYSISVSQEMVGLGMANFAGSFFSAFPGTGGLCRCVVQSRAGAKTPLAGGFTGIVVIIAILFMTPVFSYVPLPTLAAMIVIAAKKLIMSYSTVRKLFKMDKMDFVLCLICLLTTFFGGSQLGIYIALGLSFFILIVRIAHPHLSVLYKVIENNDHYVDRKNPDFAKESPLPGVIIFRPKESILFPNIEYLKNSMMNVILEETMSKAPPQDPKDQPWSDDLSAKGDALRLMRSKKLGVPPVSPDQLPPLVAVVLDMTGVNRIDASGLQGLIDFKERCATYSGLNNSIIQVKCVDEESSQNTECPGFDLYFVTNDPDLIRKLTESGLVGSVVIEPTDSKGEKCIHGNLLHSTVGRAVEAILG
ncbi:sulfate permease [Conidiobolus coronatus NRRL 28638]|uniref:Sulfate permease n=1 Tax=Conidiobolus coronatus (strain ATCC 28846 / CBS 209.66 / NRRL 28638) TaxID=796925 RepID=A0A137P2J5_CONC2|nr:sulfate permease [Conidiobolus coronatus NRRL 28638]|eukprot:KXN69124.1 sulfate permease [Conidiobolus coronatus NRRL 28638]